ncbi:MAG: ion channel [Roseivirga sp.]
MKETLGTDSKPKKEKKSRELGFGNKAYSRETRLINKGGGFNVEKEGQSFWDSLDTYHELISMSWSRFFLLITGFFFGINLIFAFLYFISGPDAIEGVDASTEVNRFLQTFYFSTQTITTVGFGKLNPNTDFVSIVSAFESFLGLLGFALATGLMFARFSRPGKRLVYSEKMLISPYRDINALMFRFANSGNNQMIEAEVDLVVSMWNTDQNRRIFERLKLERNKINFFSMSWTIVHPLTKDSPLYGMSAADMKAQQVEIIAMFKAFDDSYARHIYDRTSYTHTEIVSGKKFIPVYEDKDDDMIHINMEKIGQFEDAHLN